MTTGSLKREFENVFGTGGARALTITTEGNEVNLTELLVPLESPGLRGECKWGVLDLGRLY